MARDGNTILRIIHYPPVPEGADPASMRSAPHEDINLITLLCEATAEGLELLTREGDWLPIRALPGQIIVDAGDMLQNLTNGVLKSTTHRVVNPPDARERRFSMPFFVHPRSEVSLAPLPGCIARSGGEQRYPDITAGDYLHQRLKEIGLAT
jgi:isopenicillin N synthase-like dioxygenase